jgi:hypothetical protein
MFFSAEDRERAHLERAHADPRVVAGAVVGSEAEGSVDRFSDTPSEYEATSRSLTSTGLGPRAPDSQVSSSSTFLSVAIYRVFPSE